MPKYRHKLYPSPLILTNHGAAAFADYTFETDDEDLAAELERNPEIERLDVPAEPEPEEQPEPEPEPEPEPASAPAPKRRRAKAKASE